MAFDISAFNGPMGGPGVRGPFFDQYGPYWLGADGSRVTIAPDVADSLAQHPTDANFTPQIKAQLQAFAAAHPRPETSFLHGNTARWNPQEQGWDQSTFMGTPLGEVLKFIPTAVGMGSAFSGGGVPAAGGQPSAANWEGLGEDVVQPATAASQQAAEAAMKAVGGAATASPLMKALAGIGGLVGGQIAGHIGAASAVPPQLSDLLDLMTKRAQAQTPVFNAVQQGTWTGLPNYATLGLTPPKAIY